MCMKKFLSVLFSLLLTGVLLFSGFKLEQVLNRYRVAKDITTTTSREVRKGRDVDFDKLLKRNPDVNGWIYIKDTPIDYPIVQYSGDEDTAEPFYLHRDLDKNWLYDGTLFVDSAVERPYLDFNTIIYGHHMASGAMFHDLDKFKDREFFDSHHVVILETPEKSYDLHVIAFLNEPSYSEIYTAYFPQYMEEIADANEDDDSWMTKKGFVEFIKEKGINVSDEEFDENDRYVVLSTCAYEYEEARHQVVCTIQEPTEEDKTQIIEKDKPFINIWLIAQIVVGIVMVLAVILLLFPPGKKTPEGKHTKK